MCGRSVVCALVSLVNPAEVAEFVKILFVWQTCVGLRNRVLNECTYGHYLVNTVEPSVLDDDASRQ